MRDEVRRAEGLLARVAVCAPAVDAGCLHLPV